MQVSADQWVDLETAHEISNRSIDALRRYVRGGRLESRRAGPGANAKIEISVGSLAHEGLLPCNDGSEHDDPGCTQDDHIALSAERDLSQTARDQQAALMARLELMERQCAAQGQTISALLRVLELAVGAHGGQVGSAR